MTGPIRDGEMTPAKILKRASEHGCPPGDDADTSTDGGRAAVREFVETLEPGATVRVRARRIHVAVGEAEPGVQVSALTGRTFERGAGVDVQCIGRTLGAMARGVTPDDFLPHVSVSKWDETCDGGPTTWEIEVDEVGADA